MKKHVWAILYSCSLIGFTVYLLLDTFVITRVYSVVEMEEEMQDTAEMTESDAVAEVSAETETGETAASIIAEVSAETEEAGASDEAVESIVTENTYIDANIAITITEYREYETAIYVADITVSAAEYLQTAFAQSAYGRNLTEKTSEIAQEVDAILAINGDYYGARESGYVIRNGVLYRDTASDGQEDLAIYADGSFGMILEDEIAAEKLLDDGAVQVLSFGPALIEDRVISVSEGDEVGKAKESNPRTAIGIVDSLHYVFVVSDGRTEESDGLTLSELAEFMSALGVAAAYNLDGGGSSTMYFNGKIVNNPATTGESIKERKVSDIVYIGY